MSAPARARRRDRSVVVMGRCLLVGRGTDDTMAEAPRSIACSGRGTMPIGAPVAQRIERGRPKACVGGSIPSRGTKKMHRRGSACHPCRSRCRAGASRRGSGLPPTEKAPWCERGRTGSRPDRETAGAERARSVTQVLGPPFSSIHPRPADVRPPRGERSCGPGVCCSTASGRVGWALGPRSAMAGVHRQHRGCRPCKVPTSPIRARTVVDLVPRPPFGPRAPLGRTTQRQRPDEDHDRRRRRVRRQPPQPDPAAAGTRRRVRG